MSMEIGIERTAIKVIDFGALPNANIKYIPHGLTFEQYSSVCKIWGIVTYPSATWKIPIPYTNAATPESVIQLDLSITEVGIRTAADRTTLTAKVYIEYEID